MNKKMEINKQNEQDTTNFVGLISRPAEEATKEFVESDEEGIIVWLMSPEEFLKVQRKWVDNASKG